MGDKARILRDGIWEPIDPEVFFALPLAARVRHMLDRTVEFERNGAPIEMKKVLEERRGLAGSRAGSNRPKVP